MSFSRTLPSFNSLQTLQVILFKGKWRQMSKCTSRVEIIITISIKKLNEEQAKVLAVLHEIFRTYFYSYFNP